MACTLATIGAARRLPCTLGVNVTAIRRFPGLPLIVAATILVAACSKGPTPADIRAGAGLPPIADVRAEFRTALRPGDPSEKVEAVFRSRELDVSYDKFQNLYHGTMRSKHTTFYAIEIDVKLDAEKKVASVDVNESYTMP
jgi:hypothetical protein